MWEAGSCFFCLSAVWTMCGFWLMCIIRPKQPGRLKVTQRRSDTVAYSRGNILVLEFLLGVRGEKNSFM